MNIKHTIFILIFLPLTMVSAEPFQQWREKNTEILIQGYEDVDLEELIHQTEEPKKIEKLFIDSCQITDEDVFLLASHFPNIKTLYLNGDRLTDEAVCTIVKSLPLLKALHLSAKSGNGVMTDEAIGYLEKKKRPLNYLHLAGHPNITEDRCVAFVTQLNEKRNQKLRFVPEYDEWEYEYCLSEELLIEPIEGRYIFKSCADMNWPDAGFLASSVGVFTEALNLGMLTDDDLAFILSKISHHERFLELCIGGAFITDRSLQLVAELFPNLSYFVLASKWTTVEGIRAMATHCTELEDIDLIGMREMPLSESELYRLVVDFPEIWFGAWDLPQGDESPFFLQSIAENRKNFFSRLQTRRN